MVQAKLVALAAVLNLKPSMRHHLKDVHPLAGPVTFDATIQWVTWDGQSGVHAVFKGGRMWVGSGPVAGADATIRCKGLEQMRALFDPEVNPLDMIISNDVALEGNISVLGKFDHMAKSVLLGGERLPLAPAWAGPRGPERWQDLPVHGAGEPCTDLPEGETTHVEDLAFSDLTLDDFPRIKRLLWVNRTTLPEVCTERARLLTEHVLEEKATGRKEGSAPLRQARALEHMLERKRAILWPDDPIAGTTTSHRIGVPIYPELGGTWSWSELLTCQARELNPYVISAEDVEVLDRQVFPFWLDGNVRQWALERGRKPEAVDLDMRFALYFMWKSQAVSHTVADVPRALARGLLDIRDEAARRELEAEDEATRDVYRAMQRALAGVMAYSSHLAERARQLAAGERGDDPGSLGRRAELEEIARICDKVPARPAETLREAVQAIWTLFVAQHMESFNAGMVLGRLDLWLDPYLQRDLEGVSSPEERRRVLREALELACALMLKATDNIPTKPSAGNRIFSGSSANQVITLGGTTGDGTSAVCDMTWILLKATEMLHLRDPNVNARVAPGVTSEAYLRRLCEVNLLTGATPSLHSDDAVVPALLAQGFTLEHARDWTATGCVEPTSCGRHLGHTNSMMFSMVAPLEMMLRDGFHPLMGEQVGPRTGDPRRFTSYEQLLEAYEEQLGWLIDMSVTANNTFGRAHQALKPTPLLSALFTGPMEKRKDLLDGGAVYDTSGVALVGFTDVVDSLSAVKTLVFDRCRTDIDTLLAALDADFEGHEALLAEIENRVPKFGQEHPLPREIADDLMGFVHARYGSHRNYRGGRYLPGYWTMSYHVAFGELSGALPSGRRKGKAFTPGLTPSTLSRTGLTEQVRAVAGLDPIKMPNNIAFNVRVVPGPEDTHRQVVDSMAAYAAAYFDLGGMQMQWNVVSTATLRKAMDDPAAYRDLLVRISGYNVYFVDLTPEAQIEVIERAEHALSARS